MHLVNFKDHWLQHEHMGKLVLEMFGVTNYKTKIIVIININIKIHIHIMSNNLPILRLNTEFWTLFVYNNRI